MDVFNFHSKLLMICGFSRSTGPVKKYLFKLLQIWNIFVLLFFFQSSILYGILSDDILSICESAAPSFSGLYTFVKCVVLYFSSHKFFECMDQMDELNEKCKQ